MSRGIELPDQERCEKILLSIWYRARHSRGYRRQDGGRIGSDVDPETGLEKSEADLLPVGQGILGPEFVFKAPVLPDRLAEEVLLRDEHDGSTPSLSNCQAIGIEADMPDLESPGQTKKVAVVFRVPTNERARAESELEHVRKDHPEWNPRIRVLTGREAWTEEEATAHAEMVFRFQKTLLAFADRGWVKLEAPWDFTSVGPDNLPLHPGADLSRYKKGTDSTGLPWVATVTPEGLDEAERRIAGDPVYSQGAFSSVAAMSGEQRAKVASRNPWANRRFLQEGGR